MPLPAHLTSKLSHTVNGNIPYVTLHDNYREDWAANANQITVECLVAWEESSDWLKAMVGYTTWVGASPTLNRYLPEPCPLEDGLWCDLIGLLKMGVNKDTTDLADGDLNNYPKADWLRYRVTFKRPPYWVRSDATLAASYADKEQFRYVKQGVTFVPRERRVPSYGFEFNDRPDGSGTWHPVDEVGFIPEVRTDFLCTWTQIPVGAIPWTNIQNGAATVNSAPFKPSDYSREYPAGELLFKGPQTPFEVYQGADGAFYMDLSYLFSFQPGGWNKYLLRTRDGGGNREYGPMRARDTAGNPPPYPSSNFQLLFTPAAA